jgi:hypothetical protein
MAAAWNLGELGDPECIPHLVAALDGKDLELRQRARVVLESRFKWKPAGLAEQALIDRLDRLERKRQIQEERQQRATQRSSKKSQLHVGMPLADIIRLLGQPDSSAGGSDLLAGAGRTFGAHPNSLRGRAWYTWRRPEGTYTLTIQDGMLANIQNAPD